MYDAFRADCRLSPLPPLPIQFADFAERQRERLKGQPGRAHADYWKQQLHGSLPVLDVPTDREREPTNRFQVGCETLELSESLSDTLRVFSGAEDATLFMTLLAAFQILMHRHTRDADIVVGAGLAGPTTARTGRTDRPFRQHPAVPLERGRRSNISTGSGPVA